MALGQFVPPVQTLLPVRATLLSTQIVNSDTLNEVYSPVNVPRPGVLAVMTAGIKSGGTNMQITSVTVDGVVKTSLFDDTTTTTTPVGGAGFRVAAGNRAISVQTRINRTSGTYMAAWLLENVVNEDPVSFASKVDRTASASDSINLNFPAGSFGAMIHVHWGNSNTVWTGAEELTDHWHSNYGRFSAAQYLTESSEPSRSITAAFTNQNSGTGGLVWR